MFKEQVKVEKVLRLKHRSLTSATLGNYRQTNKQMDLRFHKEVKLSTRWQEKKFYDEQSRLLVFLY